MIKPNRLLPFKMIALKYFNLMILLKIFKAGKSIYNALQILNNLKKYINLFLENFKQKRYILLLKKFSMLFKKLLGIN
jgi:hypothetical protein